MKRQSTKTVMSVLVAAAVIVSLSACGSKVQPLQSSESTNNQNQSVSNNSGANAGTASNGDANAASNDGNANAGTNAANEVNAGGTGASADANGAAGGKSTDTPATAKQKQDISVYYTDDQMIDLHAQKAEIAYADAHERLTAAFAALQKDSDKGEASLWKNVKLLSIKLDGGAVTIDIHLPDEARLGAPGEQLAIAAISQTFFQFKDVASLDILVDGEAVDSLMGHEDLEHPIKKQ